MNSLMMFFVILSLAFGGISYLVSSNIIVGVIVLLLSFIYFFLFAVPTLRKYLAISSKFHSCYSFINAFLISLSVKGSLVAAFDYVKLSMDKDYLNLIEGISTLKEEEKLEYLASYYHFDIYQLFLSIINIFQEQGGEIFSLSNYLINETRMHEDYLITSESIGKRRLIDFISLWLLTFVILIILRFSLNQFYDLIAKQIIYLIMVVALFVITLISIHLFIIKYTKVELRGFKHDR